MQYKSWVFCMMCERAFEAHFSKDPTEGSIFDHMPDLEMQFGEIEFGEVYAACPYADCTASPLNFRMWPEFVRDYPDWPETPESDVVYSFH